MEKGIMSVKVKISSEFLAICQSKEQLQMLLEAVSLPQDKVESKVMGPSALYASEPRVT
jgi:hypothetical protein